MRVAVISLRLPIRILFAALIAMSLQSYFSVSQSYWILLTAIAGLHMGYSLLWRQKLRMIAEAGLITVLLVLLVNQLVPMALPLIAFFLLVIFASVYIGVKNTTYWPAAFIILLLVVVSAALPVSLSASLMRALLMLLGFLIAMMLEAIVFPSRAIVDVKVTLIRCIRAIIHLNDTLFACFEKRDYQQNHFFYERELFQHRRDILYAINQSRLFIDAIARPNKVVYEQILNEIEFIYEIMQAVSNLTYRVSDHTTFEVVQRELMALANNIHVTLRKLSECLAGSKNSVDVPVSLVEDILQLEEVYRSALQVVSREPMVFLHVVYDLYALNDAMVELASRIENLQKVEMS